MLGRLACFLAAATISAAAYAQPITHPIWASTPDASWDGAARAQFAVALAKRGLGAPETVALTAPPATPAADLLAQGMTALRAAAYERAAALLGDAGNQALATGGAGLAPGQAASLFFHQAVAIQVASGATYSEPFTAITPPAAKTAYLRAAGLGGGGSLDDAATQPLVEASWRLAKSLAAARPRTTLTVNAHARAKVSVDGREFQPSPASVAGLPTGEHFVLVEEPGHAPWSTTLDIGGAGNSIDVPATALLVYDAAAAISQARAKGAAFALVGQLHLAGTIEIDLRLLDARTGELRATTAVALAETPESPDLVAAVLRLDEMAAQADLARRAAGEDGKARPPLSLAPPPARATTEGGPQFGSDTSGWLHLHWPLAAAVGAAVGTALALGIVVAKDHR
jgi:hypothetical protein